MKNERDRSQKLDRFASTHTGDCRREIIFIMECIVSLLKVNKERQEAEMLEKEIEEKQAQHSSFQDVLEALQQDIGLVIKGSQSTQNLELKLAMFCASGLRETYKAWPIPNPTAEKAESDEVPFGEERKRTA